MTLELFLMEYKTVLGAFSIAVATVIAVLINQNHQKRIDFNHKRERSASFSSAVAAELTDNAHNLMDLFFQISSKKPGKGKISSYKEFSLMVYETFLGEIGTAGSSLSYMIVDVYNDIRRIRIRLDSMSDEEILEKDDDLLPEIQTVIVKALTTSVIMYFYADYMSGKKWAKIIKEKRLLWVEKTLDEFCVYIGQTDQNIDFIPAEENASIEFSRRFQDKQDRTSMHALIEDMRWVLDRLHTYPSWKMQLVLRALSYRFRITLVQFLNIEPYDYDVIMDKEYSEYLKR